MRDGVKLNRHRARVLWWSMTLSENRLPLFRIMLSAKKSPGDTAAKDRDAFASPRGAALPD